MAADRIRDDDGKGFERIHLSRTECGMPSRVERRIAAKDGKAQCVDGGAVQRAAMNSVADDSMHASTQQRGEVTAASRGR